MSRAESQVNVDLFDELQSYEVLINFLHKYHENIRKEKLIDVLKARPEGLENAKKLIQNLSEFSIFLRQFPCEEREAICYMFGGFDFAKSFKHDNDNYRAFLLFLISFPKDRIRHIYKILFTAPSFAEFARKIIKNGKDLFLFLQSYVLQLSEKKRSVCGSIDLDDDALALYKELDFAYLAKLVLDNIKDFFEFSTQYSGDWEKVYPLLGSIDFFKGSIKDVKDLAYFLQVPPSKKRIEAYAELSAIELANSFIKNAEDLASFLQALTSQNREAVYDALGGIRFAQNFIKNTNDLASFLQALTPLDRKAVYDGLGGVQQFVGFFISTIPDIANFLQKMSPECNLLALSSVLDFELVKHLIKNEENLDVFLEALPQDKHQVVLTQLLELSAASADLRNIQEKILQGGDLILALLNKLAQKQVLNCENLFTYIADIRGKVRAQPGSPKLFTPSTDCEKNLEAAVALIYLRIFSKQVFIGLFVSYLNLWDENPLLKIIGSNSALSRLVSHVRRYSEESVNRSRLAAHWMKLYP